MFSANGGKFVSGGVDATWYGPLVTLGVIRGGILGVNKALEYGKAISVPLTPLGPTGNLRESANIRPATLARTEGVLIFDTVYAAAQHEHEEYRHDDGQAKYVEEPWTQHQATFHKIIAEGVRVGIIRS